MIQIPEFVVEQYFAKIIRWYGDVPQKELEEEYLNIFQDPFIQEDPQFVNDEQRHSYAAMVLWSRYVGRPRLKEYDIIPLGYFSKRMTKRGDAISNMFVIAKEGKKPAEKKRVIFTGELADMPPNITRYCLYKVKLGFRGIDLIADVRSKFESPKTINLPPEKIYNGLGVKRVTIAEAKEFPSSVSKQGFVDMLDWRIVRGIITRKNSGARSDGSAWTNFITIDKSIDNNKLFTEEGKFIRPGLTIWVDQNVYNAYNVEDLCDFVGVIQLRKDDGTPVMNCFDIIPVIKR